MPDLKFNIQKKLGVLGENSSGWRKELNYVSWNDRPAKLDIREWEPEHKKMSKGLTFTKPEALELGRLFASLNFDEIEDTPKAVEAQEAS